MSADFAAQRTTHAIIDAARANLAEDIWDYIVGAAESETTARRNRLGIDSLVLRPRVGRDVSAVEAAGSLLGHRLRIPVLLAPLGALEAVVADGGIAAVRAAERFGTMAVISSVTEPSFEAIAAASTAAKAAQLYIRGDADWAAELLGRVGDAGYDAIVLTVDSAHYGRRERQLRTGWHPPTHTGGGPEPGIVWQARLTWDRLEAMREQAGRPAMVKGIQTGRDAEIAVERGFEVVWVSNHGGRDLDHADATIESLREVVEAIGGSAEIVVDGGFLRGTDILKAVALGATAVAIGRLEALALAAGGEAALVRVLEILEEEITVAMALLGVTQLSELDASYVRRAPALQAQSPLLAAFPERAADWPRDGGTR